MKKDRTTTLLFLQRGLAHQESLLQHYRSFYLAVQAVFLAVGWAIFRTALHVQQEPLRTAAFVVLIVIIFAGFAIVLSLRRILKNRAKAVTWWQFYLMEAESPSEDGALEEKNARPYFTDFKRHQKNPTDFDRKLADREDEKVTLLREDCKSPRVLIHCLLTGGYAFLWVSLVLLAVFAFFGS